MTITETLEVDVSKALKTCPFCNTKPEVNVRAYRYPPSCFVYAEVCCPSCRCVTNNELSARETRVSQSVFWTDAEILKHVPRGLKLYDKNHNFDSTTAKAAEAAARRVAIEMWQRRGIQGGD